MMKVFIAENVLCDYTCGMIVVIASDKERAIEIVKKKFDWITQKRIPKELKEISLEEEEQVFYVWGGG